MQQNTGPYDRALRVALGLTLIAVMIFASLSTPVIIGLGVVAAIAIGTAVAGFCPLYRVIGLSTCPAPPPAGRSA